MKRHSAMPIEKAFIKTSEGKEIAVTEQTPIPCFRCGICCTFYQAPLTPEDLPAKTYKEGLHLSGPGC